MKKNMFKFIAIIFVIGCISIFNNSKTYALPYYDLKFEKVSEKIVKGEYEYIGDKIDTQGKKEAKIVIKKSYETSINKELNKDEIDAISQVCGNKWNEKMEINKEEKVNIKRNKDNYFQVRPVYKEIKGYLIEDYTSWKKKEEVIILIPIDTEYNLEVK